MGPTGEPEDFASWYEREHTRLVTSLLLVAGDADRAAEATDEAFARAYAAWGRVSLMASPRGWTYRVALNVLRRRGRRARLEQTLLSRQPPPGSVPPPAGEAWDAVRCLPPRQRTAIVLRFVADLTEEQVAEIMGVTRSTVSATLAHARHHLALQLGDDDGPSLEVGCA